MHEWFWELALQGDVEMIFSIACAKVADNIATINNHWQVRQGNSIDKLDKIFLADDADGIVKGWTDEFIPVIYVFIEIASNSHIIAIVVSSDLFQPLKRMLVFDVVVQ